LLITVDGLGLFADEQLVADRMVAEWAHAHGWRTVDVDEAAAVFAKARRGLQVDSGEECGLPLSRDAAQKRYAERLSTPGHLLVSIWCRKANSDCKMVLSVWSETKVGPEQLKEQDLAAPYDVTKRWPEAMKEALAKLRGSGGGGGGVVGGVMGGVVEANPERFTVTTNAIDASTLKYDQSASLPLGSAVKPLRACFASGVSESATLLLQIDRSGSISRCASDDVETPLHACACAAIAHGVRAKAKVAGARLHLHASLQVADTVNRAQGRVSAFVNTYVRTLPPKPGQKWSTYAPEVSDPSIASWQGPEASSIERCFANTKVLGAIQGNFTVSFDAKGQARQVDIHSDKSLQGLDATTKACLHQALMSSRAPCPDHPNTKAQGRFSVQIRKLGEKL